MKIGMRLFMMLLVLGCFLSLKADAAILGCRDSVPSGVNGERRLQQGSEKDDSANALIHFFETKRRSTRITTALLFAANAAAGIAYHQASRDPDPNDPINEGAGFRSLFPFLLLLLLIPVTLYSFINMFRFNKKQEAKRINSYRSGKPIAQWIRESRPFRQYYEKAD